MSDIGENWKSLGPLARRIVENARRAMDERQERERRDAENAKLREAAE